MRLFRLRLIHFLLILVYLEVYGLLVCFNEQRSKFMACCSVNGKDKYLGYFATPEEAHAVYKQFKENLCKELANKWRIKIDERVYNAMMFWSV